MEHMLVGAHVGDRTRSLGISELLGFLDTVGVNMRTLRGYTTATMNPPGSPPEPVNE